MRSVKKTRVNFCRHSFRLEVQSKESNFSTDCIRQSVSQSKKVESKSPLSTCIEERSIWASVEKGRFRLTNPTVYEMA